ILDEAVEQELNDFTNQPELEANLRLAVADTYKALAEFGKAERMAREALRLRKSIFGESNIVVADCLDALASVMLDRGGPGDLSTAEPLARQALAIRESALGREHVDVARSQLLLASVLMEERKLDEAELRHREALRIRRKVSGDDKE